jgi:chromate transporter
VAASLPALFWTFLKMGSLVLGSGYVLVSFLRSELVDGAGWLTEAQLVDAVAAGHVTPGPLFTTATFVGYLLAGIPGAVVATVAIFLPAFLLVAITTPLAKRLRRGRLTASALDGVNAAALGLLAAVSVQLALSAVTDALTALLSVVALALLIWRALPSAWVIAAGAAVGLLARGLGTA